VGNQYAVHAFGGTADLLEPVHDFAGTETGIDEQTHLWRFEVRAISFAPTAEYADPQRRLSSVFHEVVSGVHH
jgi:hypothetical protein